MYYVIRHRQSSDCGNIWRYLCINSKFEYWSDFAHASRFTCPLAYDLLSFYSDLNAEIHEVEE